MVLLRDRRQHAQFLELRNDNLHDDDHGDSIQHATSWNPNSAMHGIIRYALVGT